MGSDPLKISGIGEKFDETSDKKFSRMSPSGAGIFYQRTFPKAGTGMTSDPSIKRATAAQDSGKSPIGAVDLREGLPGFCDLPIGMEFDELLEKLVIFFRFDGTGRVDEATAGLQARESLLKNGLLDPGEVGDVLRTEPPSHVDTTAKHAGIRAWDVQKDRVKSTVPFCWSRLSPVVGLNGIGSDVEP